MSGTVVDDVVVPCSYCGHNLHEQCVSPRHNGCQKAKEVIDRCKELQADEFQKLKCVLLNEKAKLPWKAEGAAGYDLTSVVDCDIPAHGSRVVQTGVAMAILPGWYGRIAPRSG